MKDQERELLLMLIEECAEVQHAATKALRHGLNSFHPERDPKFTNRHDLEYELSDLMTIIWRLQQLGALDNLRAATLGETWDRKKRYTHHQGYTGHQGLD